jgi:Coenzyme PQQ synthesis protein D (PqqD)
MAAVLKKSENVVFRKIENEYILVPIKSNAAELDYIYTLNEVGARIWELIDGTRTVGDIRDIICSEYEVTPETAVADLDALLAELAVLSTVAMVA